MPAAQDASKSPEGPALRPAQTGPVGCARHRPEGRIAPRTAPTPTRRSPSCSPGLLLGWPPERGTKAAHEDTGAVGAHRAEPRSPLAAAERSRNEKPAPPEMSSRRHGGPNRTGPTPGRFHFLTQLDQTAALPARGLYLWSTSWSWSSPFKKALAGRWLLSRQGQWRAAGCREIVTSAKCQGRFSDNKPRGRGRASHSYTRGAQHCRCKVKGGVTIWETKFCWARSNLPRSPSECQRLVRAQVQPSGPCDQWSSSGRIPRHSVCSYVAESASNIQGWIRL